MVGGIDICDTSLVEVLCWLDILDVENLVLEIVASYHKRTGSGSIAQVQTASQSTVHFLRTSYILPIDL